MNGGNPKIKVSKTDLARYLNDHGADFPELARYWEDYMQKCARARKDKASQFGFWVRTNKPKVFEKIWKWGKKHLEILDEVYKNNADSTIETI